MGNNSIPSQSLLNIQWILSTNVYDNFHRIHENMEKFKAIGKSYYLLGTIILSPQELRTE